MSRSRTRRPTTRTRPRPGLLGTFGRWLLGSVLLVVLLLFLASVLGVFDWGRRDRIPPAEMAGGGWEVPSQRLSLESTSTEPASRWNTEVLAAGESGQAPVVGEAAGPPIRVYVTNGCGVNRLASSLRPRLQEAGFDVCGVENADRSDYSETLIVDRCGDLGKAEAVCAFFQEQWGVGRVLLQARSSSETEVLVILGRDLGEQRLRPGR